MRVRKKNWVPKELAENELILGEPPAEGFDMLFGQKRPLHVEIGCGKGGFIVETALNNPDINYIALEREPSVIVNGARTLREIREKGRQTDNIYFLIADAKELAGIFSPGELSRIYLNFSDPWPNRKKWQKRRLTHENFLAVYKMLLNDSGEIHFKTDNPQLFEFSICRFSQNGFALKNVSLDLHNSGFEGNIMTEYERKFAQRGMAIYRLEAYKI